MADTDRLSSGYERRLGRTLGLYIAGVCGFLLLLAWAERQGLARHWLGPLFLFTTVMVYAAIGIWGRTTDAEEYYVAGRRIPPMYNGMATAADWMSAASFISLAGGLYLQGFTRHAGSSRAAWPTCWAGPAASAWWRCWSRRTCAGMGLYTVPDYFQRALWRCAGRAAWPLLGGHRRARSPTWWPRSTASA